MEKCCCVLFSKTPFVPNSNFEYVFVRSSHCFACYTFCFRTNRETPTEGEVDRHSRLVVGYYSQHFDELLPVAMGKVNAVQHLIQQHGKHRGGEMKDHEARKLLGEK